LDGQKRAEKEMAGGITAAAAKHTQNGKGAGDFAALKCIFKNDLSE